MRTFLAALAGAACLCAAVPGAIGFARSEPAGPLVAGLPPAEILATVRRAGFVPAGKPLRRPGVYAVRAHDADRRLVDLTLDARSGRLMGVRPAGRAPLSASAAPARDRSSMFPRRRTAFGLARGPLDDPAGFEDSNGALPSPPRAIPAGHASPAWSRSAAVLPLPRPRPPEAAAPAPPAATLPMPPVMPLE